MPAEQHYNKLDLLGQIGLALSGKFRSDQSVLKCRLRSEQIFTPTENRDELRTGCPARTGQIQDTGSDSTTINAAASGCKADLHDPNLNNPPSFSVG